MKIDWNRIEADAREHLDPDSNGHPADRLCMRHRFGLGELEIARARGYQLDLQPELARSLGCEAARGLLATPGGRPTARPKEAE